MHLAGALIWACIFVRIMWMAVGMVDGNFTAYTNLVCMFVAAKSLAVAQNSDVE